MNLTKLTLFSCPIILAALVLVSSPAEASTPANLLQPGSVEVTVDHHAISVAVASPSERPRIPTGCSCARCTKAEELLQGQLPAF
ncbi:hypothetical protein ACN4EK_03020 [Pantanalinema rosaneae CENA516]|uniref:hypothetical protein n=1 Tax=Pantanalinema rosaneae TaxID=1620701 RepID=UPI003D6F30D3